MSEKLDLKELKKTLTLLRKLGATWAKIGNLEVNFGSVNPRVGKVPNAAVGAQAVPLTGVKFDDDLDQSERQKMLMWSANV